MTNFGKTAKLSLSNSIKGFLCFLPCIFMHIGHVTCVSWQTVAHNTRHRFNKKLQYLPLFAPSSNNCSVFDNPGLVVQSDKLLGYSAAWVAAGQGQIPERILEQHKQLKTVQGRRLYNEGWWENFLKLELWDLLYMVCSYHNKQWESQII